MGECKVEDGDVEDLEEGLDENNENDVNVNEVENGNWLDGVDESEEDNEEDKVEDINLCGGRDDLGNEDEVENMYGNEDEDGEGDKDSNEERDGVEVGSKVLGDNVDGNVDDDWEDKDECVEDVCNKDDVIDEKENENG